MTTEKEPIKYEGWPEGMNNISPDYSLPEGTLRTVVNADIWSHKTRLSA